MKKDGVTRMLNCSSGNCLHDTKIEKLFRKIIFLGVKIKKRIEKFYFGRIPIYQHTT